MKPLKPSRLRAGDLIGLVSPASPIADPSRIDKGVRYLESLGYRVEVAPSVLKSHGYLAGTDEERAGDLHAFFARREVRAIMCIRGGYGTPRLLRLINYRLIASNPKIFVGYSDLTALQLAIWKKTGLVQFHGPMVGVDMADQMDAFTESLFWKTLTATGRAGAIALPDPQPVSLTGGKARGRLVGGNLALLVSSMGTRYFPDLRDSLLYLEDIGEEPYRVDRMLFQLLNAGILGKVSGILTGQFTDCGPKDTTKPSFSVDEVFRQIAELSGRPFLAGLPFGHESRKMTLPLGITALVDATKGTVEYLEPAVVR
jgi:muramoyltetrapeptide carboxypeptidase